MQPANTATNAAPPTPSSLPSWDNTLRPIAWKSPGVVTITRVGNSRKSRFSTPTKHEIIQRGEGGGGQQQRVHSSEAPLHRRQRGPVEAA